MVEVHRNFLIRVPANPNTVATRFQEQYPINGAYPDKIETGKRLAALVNPTRDEIEAIIGNDTWTRIFCDMCRQEAKALAVVGAEYSSSGTACCANCLKQAAQVIEWAEK